MSDTIKIRLTLIRSGTASLLLFAAMAWCSNPDQASFNRWAGRQVQRQAGNGWERLAGRIITPVALAMLDVERTDFGLFSVVVIHADGDMYFLGGFGHWIRVS